MSILSRSRTLTSLFTRSLTSLSSRSSFSSLTRLRPLLILTDPTRFGHSGVGIGFGGSCFSSESEIAANGGGGGSGSEGKAQLDDEEIMLDGCDFKHWLIVMEGPLKPVEIPLEEGAVEEPVKEVAVEGEEGSKKRPVMESASRDEIIDWFIQTLAQVVGSEQEARKSIYSVSHKHYYAFGCIIPQELSSQLTDLPKVQWVLPDSYMDVPTKSYGGEPFINGQAVPYHPKYHMEWVKNNERTKNPPNNDRSRGNRRGGPPNQNMSNMGGGRLKFS